MAAPKRHANREKTHCKYGHPFDEENTYWRKRKGRVARICKKCRAMYRQTKKLGITPEKYFRLLEQGDLCAICGGVNTSGYKLALDHNAKTGKPRARLCSTCNTGLGMFHEDPVLLQAAIDYLELWREAA